MKRLDILVVILALFSLTVIGCKESASTTKTTASTSKTPEEIADSTVRAIKRNFESDSPAAAFDSFKKAVQMGDGKSAAEMVSEETMAYYSDVYQKVMSASSQEVQNLPIGEHIMILMSRLTLPDRGLKNMDQTTFLTNLVETGSIDKIALSLIEVGNIEVSGNTATAPVIIKQIPANVNIDFVQDDQGKWKINLANAIPKAVDYYHERFTSSNIDLNTHVRNTIKAFAEGGQFPASIYAPLQ